MNVKSPIVMLMLLTLVAFTSGLWAQENDRVYVTTLAWSHDGIKIAVGYQGGVMEVFDATSGESLWSHQFSDVVNSLKWHPSNPDHLAIGGGNPARGEGIVQVLDVATNQILLTLDGGESISSLSWSPDETKLVAASNVIFPSAIARVKSENFCKSRDGMTRLKRRYAVG